MLRIIKRELLDIYYVCKNEMLVVLKDPAAVLIFFIVPLFYPLVYSFIYNNEVARDVKMVTVDESNSSLAREFSRKVDATADVKIVGYATDLEEAKRLMADREITGILYFPREFSKKIHRQEQARVIVYADMNSLLYYKNMLLAPTEVSLEMGADIRVEEMGYKSQIEDEATMEAVINEWIPLYNPSSGFASFLIPAVLILIIQQTMFLGIGTIIGTHNDRKTFTLASHTREGKNVDALRLTIGKAFCYGIIYSVMSLWVLGIIPYIFNFPQIGDPVTIFIFIQPFLLAATFFTMTIAYFCSQREFAMLLFVFTSVLFVFLSGISWPWASVPPELKAIAYILPSTPGIHGFVKINTMGATLPEVWFEYMALWIQAAIYWITATLMYWWWIRNYDPKHLGKTPSKTK